MEMEPAFIVVALVGRYSFEVRQDRWEMIEKV